MSGQCKDCQYFGKTGAKYVKDDYETCKHPNVTRGYGSDLKPESRGIHVEDDEGWGLFVAPDFGCINFDKKSAG